MEILPITIAEPRADALGTPADEAKDGGFGKLLQASDEGPDFRDPAAEETPEPDRTASNDRPADDRSSPTPPTGDQDAEATGDLSAPREISADKAAATTSIESLPESQVLGSSRPTAKVPPLKAAPDARTGSAQAAQLTAATPAEKTTHAGPQTTAARSGAVDLLSSVPSNSPGAAPEPVPSGAAAPPPHLRINPRIESRPNGPAAELPAKPSDVRAGAARKDPAVVKKTAAARDKPNADGEVPRNVPKVQHSFGALSGLTAADTRPAANVAPAQRPGTTALPLGPGQSAQNGNLAPAEARPAAPPSAPPGGATEQVALRIHKAVAGGQERINIRLHPAELGRIEVKLAWSDDGLMRAMISADKGETLELLQRDQRVLERTLQDAGIKTDSGSLSFDLRGQNGRGDASDDPGPQTADSNAAEVDGADLSDKALPPAANRSLHRGLLDLSV